MSAKITIIDCLFYASLYEGKCLSKKVNSRLDILEWRCSQGHRWESSYHNVQVGHWCPQCSKNDIKNQFLEKYKQIALSHGGECLSDIYVNKSTKLKFKCQQGHVFMSAPSSLQRGGWCTTCSGRFKHSIEFYQKVAEERGGKVLSKRYVTVKVPIKWQCAEGHIFYKRPADVYQKNLWCPKCSINDRRASGALYKHTLSDMQKIAEKYNGKCLSESYSGGNTRLKWICSNKHFFETTPFTVLKGSWCKICGFKEANFKKRTPFIKIATLVKSKGGRLLTTQKEYREQYDQLKIICQSGHKWTAKLENLIKGSWCHTCRNITIANKKRLPFEVYLKMAKAKKGKLLTPESKYKGSVEKMHWQCKAGHQWMAAGSRIQQGFWCKYCRWEEKEKNKKAKLKIRK